MKLKLTYIYTIIFIIVCYIMLPVMNYDYLFTLQERSLWMSGHTYMAETIARDGWIGYVGCYLTQYFYYPWLGSTIIIAIWVLICYILNKVLELPDAFTFVPYLTIWFLPVYLLSLGYWVYFIKTPGYAFIPTIYALILSVVCMIINILFRNIKNDYFRIFRLIWVVSLLSLFKPYDYTKYNEFFITLTDNNYRHELKMYRAVDENRWNDVLAEAPKQIDKDHKHPTSLMIMFKNLALLNTDQLLDKAFEYDNCGIVPETSDDLKVKLNVQAGPMLYYHYGLVNYAYRWSIENSVKYNFSVNSLRMLIRCAIYNQEFDVAMKYICTLKSTLFYKKWAKEQEAMIRDSRLYMESEDYQRISRLQTRDDELDNDNANVSMYILNHFSNYNSSTYPFEDMSIISSLLIPQEEDYMIHFYNYIQNHPNEPTPTKMQEAAYLIGPTDMSPIDVSKFPFDENIKMGFTQFNEDYQIRKANGEPNSQIAEELLPKYGNTYWWYYYFNSEMKYY